MDPIRTGFGKKYDQKIVQLTKEGLGIRSTGRVLGISPATIIRRILEIAEKIKVPRFPPYLYRIQVDELHTYIHDKDREICVDLCMESGTKTSTQFGCRYPIQSQLKKSNQSLAKHGSGINQYRWISRI